MPGKVQGNRPWVLWGRKASLQKAPWGSLPVACKVQKQWGRCVGACYRGDRQLCKSVWSVQSCYLARIIASVASVPWRLWENSITALLSGELPIQWGLACSYTLPMQRENWQCYHRDCNANSYLFQDGFLPSWRQTWALTKCEEGLCMFTWASLQKYRHGEWIFYVLTWRRNCFWMRMAWKWVCACRSIWGHILGWDFACEGKNSEWWSLLQDYS